MDWIRRNWPDLLIAIALVAVIAGIIATLLSGGSLWPTSRGGSGSNQSQTSGRTAINGGTTGAAIDLSRNTGTANNSSAGSLTVGNAPTTSTLNRSNLEVVSPSLNANALSTGNTGATLAAPLGTQNTAGSSATSLAAPLRSPRAGSTSINADINNTNTGLSLTNNATGNTAGNVGGVVSTNGLTIPNANTASTVSTAGTQQLAGRTTFAPTQAIAGNSAASATAGGSYKVSVGAFGVAANAENLANRLNQQGYPVGYDRQGSLNVVYVGPFASQAEADAVSGQLRQAGQDTSVYADEQVRSSATTTATTTAQAVQQNQNFQQQQQQSVTTTAPAGAGSSYLQVGAYNDVQTSLPQRSTLEGLGLTVYDRREGGYVKLVVGPFAANEVEIYRSQLLDRGIDSFPTN